MSFRKVFRRDHQQRAERLEARFSPTWTGQAQPTGGPLSSDPSSNPNPNPIPNPVLPSAPPQPDHPGHDKPIAPVPQPVSQPAPVQPATTPVVTFPTTSASVVVVPSPVVPTTSSSSIILAPVIPSSSSAVLVQTTPIIVATPSSVTPVFSTPTTFRSLPPDTYTPTSTTSTSASPASSTSSGMKTGSIVGIAAASIAGVAVLGVAGIWLLKRYFNSRDEDDAQPGFQRHSWMRNSVALPDDASSPIVQGPSVHPRPPTMIERKQTQRFANVSPGGYAQNQGGFYQDYSSYPQDNSMGMGHAGSPYGGPPMPSFNPGEHVGSSQNSAQPFFSPIGSPPLRSPGVASFDESTPPVQHASYDAATMGVPAYFSRPDANMNRGYPDPMPNPHNNEATDGYATLNRSSLTPYQAQQYAAISRQLHDPALEAVAEAPAPSAVHEASPFEDPASVSAPEQHYQELTIPTPAHARIDSTPPSLPPMRTMSSVVAAQPSITQFANAFPPAPTSPHHPAFPAPVANPTSPKSPSFKQAPPLSPAPGAQGQVVSVPDGVHAGQETAVYTTEAVAIAPKAKRMSVASRKSAKSGRPETLYDEEDAYGGI